MPNSPRLVGITGGIGAGKSTVCELFHLLGVVIYNADDRAKILMNTDQKIIESITTEFGSLAYQNTQINRDYLAKTVFADPDKIKKLNQIVHPAIALDFKKWIVDQKGKYVIKEAALLIESGAYLKLDTLVNVYAPTAIRKLRIKHRDAFRSEDEIQKIIDRQIPEEERNKWAQKTIVNDESQLLIPQVLSLHQQFLK